MSVFFGFACDQDQYLLNQPQGLPRNPVRTKMTKILQDLTDAEVRTLADTKTPASMVGVWVLTAPDGQTWTADSPIGCIQAEIYSRTPPQVILARIRRSLMDDEAQT